MVLPKTLEAIWRQNTSDHVIIPLTTETLLFYSFSLTSKDISSLMSFDDDTEASQPTAPKITRNKPKRILPSPKKRMLPKPDWNFNSQSFRNASKKENGSTSGSSMGDDLVREKKGSQSFQGITYFLFNLLQSFEM